MELPKDRIDQIGKPENLVSEAMKRPLGSHPKDEPEIVTARINVILPAPVTSDG